MSANELLRVEGLRKYFPVTRGVFGKTVGHVRAVDDVSLTIGRGETLGLVGESGCGKTTTGRSILRLIEPTSGRIWFDGTEISALSQKELRPFRRRMQIVFQDPFGSLNPRMRVVDIVGEGIEQHGVASGAGVEARVRETLAQVGLPGRALNRYPHEFSGGQRQRIGVARAIAVAPDLLVCDEAVSALDVSIQAQVINLLIDLRRDLNLSYLFVAHDLSVVRHLCERVAVMYLGEVVELSPCAELFAEPAHPYTRALLSAIPIADPRQRRQRVVLEGDVPSPLNPPSGCHFHPRCPAALPRCSEGEPPLVQLSRGRSVRCVHAEGLEQDPDWYPQLDQRLRAAERERAESKPKAPLRLPSQSEPAFAAESNAPVAAAGATAPQRRRLDWFASSAIAAFALGLGCVLVGHWGWGIVLLGAGLASASESRRLSRWAERRRWLWLAAAVVVFAIASRWVEPFRLAMRTKRELAWLAEEVAAHAQNAGAAPEALLELRWRTIERFGAGPPLDPWGRPYSYAAYETRQGFELRSNGPDGLAGSDDIEQIRDLVERR